MTVRRLRMTKAPRQPSQKITPQVFALDAALTMFDRLGHLAHDRTRVFVFSVLST
jgi:hypothetical protein